MRPCGFATWSSSTTHTDSPGVIGILGGTFDPIHLGHLAAAEALKDRAGLQAVWLMPNAQPPHRPPPAASAEDRLEMVRRAVEGHPGLEASDLEVRRGGISYTIDTVRELARQFPEKRFAWLIGSDEARAIRSWREADRLLKAIDFIVFTRPGAAVTVDELLALGFRPAGMRLVPVQTPTIAAQDIREALRDRAPVDRFLTPAVRDYVAERGLYR